MRLLPGWWCESAKPVPVIMKQRRQPVTEMEPDDEERHTWDSEQHELQDIVKNTVHWPMAVAVCSPPASLPVTPTPSKGTTSTARQLPSAFGSPALDSGASAVAQYELQATKTMLP